MALLHLNNSAQKGSMRLHALWYANKSLSMGDQMLKVCSASMRR